VVATRAIGADGVPVAMSRRSRIFGKRASIGLVVGLSLAVVACDKLTYAQIQIETPSALDPTCVERAARDLRLTDSLGRATERADAVEVYLRRSPATVTILVTRVPPYQLRTSFGWLGKESHAVERAQLRLLQDVHVAVMSACGIEQPPAKISTRCATRHCDEWARPDG
jgi:hypothetical protein